MCMPNANDHSEHKYDWALSDTLHATCTTYVHANEQNIFSVEEYVVGVLVRRFF